MAARRDGLVTTHSTRVRRSRRLGDEFLATLQAALAVAILITATLIVGSFVKLVNSIQGIDLEGLTSIGVALPSDAYRAPEARHQFAQSFVARVEAATGQRIAVTRGLPGVTLPSPARRTGDVSTSKDTVIAYPADRPFIYDMRLELLRGRLYSLDESNRNAPVAVLDERAARFFWPEGDALGRTIDDYQTVSALPRQVVGIVRTVDVNFSSDPGHGRRVRADRSRCGRSGDSFLWRGILTESFRRGAQAAAASVDLRAHVTAAPLMPFERPLGEPRLLARLLGALGLLALLLSISGVYAIVSHAIAARTGEIGVRMALGATPPRFARWCFASR